jgi:dienelactone hydrolase
MRPDQLDRQLRARLDALGPAPQAEPLHVLMLTDFEARRTDRRVLVLSTEPHLRGALFFYAFLDPSEFDNPWPEGVSAQIHMMDDDPEVQEGDLDAARTFASATEDAELFLYAGDKHLFAGRSFSDYDEDAAALLGERTLAFLDAVS